VSSLLDKHAPIITKISNRKSKFNPWFIHSLGAFRTTLRHAESIYKRTHSARAWSNCTRKLQATVRQAPLSNRDKQDLIRQDRYPSSVSHQLITLPLLLHAPPDFSVLSLSPNLKSIRSYSIVLRSSLIPTYLYSNLAPERMCFCH